MTIAGTSFLASPPVGSHLVFPYTEEERALAAVAKYVSAGLANGEAAILVLTPEHCAAVEEHLAHDGLDVRALGSSGKYQCLDAQETLDKFMVDGMPDRELFVATVGSVVKRAKLFGKVRAYGEMVSLLYHQNTPAALRLEEFWNELIKKETISLLCTYDTRNKPDLAKDLYEQHSHCIV